MNCKMAGLFSALALGSAVALAPQAAHAEQPVAQCDASKIFEQVVDSRGQVKAFGDDGCTYNVIAGRPLAIHNYDLQNGREAQAFSNEYNSAMAGARNAAIQQQRQAEAEQRRMQQQQQRCQQQMANTIGGILNGRGVNYQQILNSGAQCNRR